MRVMERRRRRSQRLLIGATIIGSSLATTGCINMSALQTAEALPEGDGRIIVGGGYYTSPSINEAIEKETDKTTSTADDGFDDITVPYFEIGYRYGLTDRFEVGGKLTLIGTISLDGKYQLVDAGAFDVALGAGVGYVAIESESGSGDSKSKYENTIIDLTVPLYVSYRLSPGFAVYTSPKAVYRNVSTKQTVSGVSENDKTGTTLAGATAGLMIGESWGLALEGTYMKDTKSDFDMLQAAAGFFF